MTEAYAERLAACRTINEMNRLHIALEGVVAPAEFERMVAGVDPATLPPAAVHWIGRVRSFLDRSGQPIQDYAMHRFGEWARLYHHPSRGPDGRGLLIGFTGDAHRLMVPMPAFLQHCPAGRFDVLVLSDPTLSYFLHGIRGVADDFPGLLAAIERMIGRRRYARVCTLGTSGGGIAAVWAALALGLDSAIAVCPTSPTVEDPRIAARGLSYAGFLEAAQRPKPERTRIRLAFGAECARDVAKATALAELIPAELHPVAGISGHNVLYELLRLGGLRRFLEAMLPDPAPPASPAGV
ncbi:MAG: hypothetical protein AB7P02_20390 [Alphaproteobacteria bacterium]